jgi:alpha-galactosidase
MNKYLAIGIAVLAFTSPSLARAVAPTPAELTEARKWAAAKFEGVTNSPEAKVGLEVLANNDAVQPNARNGKPLQLGNQQYARGLFCHARSKVVVRLTSPGKTFQAVVGVDSNEQTSGGRGSVVFSVVVDNKTAFKSELMHEGTRAVPVQVDLAGATEFAVEVGDGGDGIACDQADWADARVVLADGQTVWLGDLPIFGANTRSYDAEPFFSFNYDSKPSKEFLKTWKFERASRPLDDNRVEHTLTYTDPKTGLQVRCIGVEYRDYPTVEWTVYFKNTGSQDTPILSDIQAVDLSLRRTPLPWAPEFRLYHQTGSPCLPSDYEPFETLLKPDTEKRIGGAGGRPTNSDLPYFNVELGTSEGLIIVVGWPGQWAARFTRDKAYGLQVRAGQELTHLKLLPGEEIRTPLMALQFWKGDRLHAQNVWRRWMLAHNLPRPGGKLPPVELAACSSHQFGEMINANTQNQKFFVDRYLQEGLKLDYWWMDAGWYWNRNGNWSDLGTWEVDTKRFPKGLREITEHMHAKGVKSIVWFEPERVMAGTWLTDNHPEWILGGKNGGLLNLGNPDAWNWLLKHVDKLLVDQGIDLYRQDFNMDPLEFWRKNDAKDRQGITENKHVVGYLTYWDELRRRHPDMLIDSCASGGRRNDLETLRRAVPLLRSDYIIEPVGNQGHTYGIAFWMPYYGTGTGAIDAYLTRSVMCPHFTACFDMRRTDLNYAEARRLINQWRQFAPYFFGDYYPLTPYSLEKTTWIAWQFDCPESGEGMVQAFRRPESIYEMIRPKLRGLDPNATYTITNMDVPGTTELSGRELLERGLPVSINEQPGSAVITYKKKP